MQFWELAFRLWEQVQIPMKENNFPLLFLSCNLMIAVYLQINSLLCNVIHSWINLLWLSIWLINIIARHKTIEHKNLPDSSLKSSVLEIDANKIFSRGKWDEKEELNKNGKMGWVEVIDCEFAKNLNQITNSTKQLLMEKLTHQNFHRKYKLCRGAN